MIEILTKKATKEIRLNCKRCANKDIYNAIGKIKVGQSVKFSVDEWYSKTLPSRAIASMTYKSKRKGYGHSTTYEKWKGKKFSIHRTFNRKHWVVIRLK